MRPSVPQPPRRYFREREGVRGSLEGQGIGGRAAGRLRRGPGWGGGSRGARGTGGGDGVEGRAGLPGAPGVPGELAVGTGHDRGCREVRVCAGAGVLWAKWAGRGVGGRR